MGMVLCVDVGDTSHNFEVNGGWGLIVFLLLHKLCQQASKLLSFGQFSEVILQCTNQRVE